MPLDDLQPTSEKGVFYRTETGRMNGRVKLDRQFVLVYKLGGKKYRGVIGWESAGHSTAEALSLLREFKQNHKAGSGPVCIAEVQAIVERDRRAREEAERAAEEAERNRPTISRLWGLYLESKPELKGVRADRSRFEIYLRELFGNKTPDQITPLDLDRLRLGMLRGKISPSQKPLSPQTVKHAMVLLRRIILFAVQRRLVPPVDLEFKLPRVDNQITEHLTDEEIQRLMATLESEPDKMAVAVVKLALFTGMRKSEMLSLKWRNVDLNRARITIDNPKGGKTQILPISSATVSLLQALPQSSELVFPGKDGKQRHDLKRSMHRIRQAAGLPEGFRPLHGLRHHFASTLASSGQVDLYTLQKLLTHKDPSTTQRYAHLRDETLRNAADVAVKALQRTTETQDQSIAKGEQGS